MRILKLFFIFLFYSAVSVLAKETTTDEHLQVRIIAPQIFSTQEETLIGLYFEPEEHWHVYWKNPGDSGAAPKFIFSSETASIGPTLWPYPQRLPVEHLTNFGYEGAVAYLFSVRPKENISEVQMNIKMEWLVCNIECVPGFAELHFKRPTHHQSSQWQKEDFEIIKKFSSRIPSSSENASFQIKKIQMEKDFLKVHAPSPDFEQIDLFPGEGEFILPAAPEKNLQTQEFIFKIQAAVKPPSSFQLIGTLKSAAWQFDNLSITSTHASTTPLTDSSSSVLSLFLLAVLGGLILNLMPCVFPVISIKVFSLLKTEDSTRTRDCLHYSAGVMITFLFLGGIFLLLRSLGAAVGWGFQLQSPPVIFALILLFWLMALNFLGVFEMGAFTMNYSSRFLKSSSSFGTGVLSVFVAAPCTGPFMGTALGAAIALPAINALFIFLGLGLGLALPFITLAISPRMLSWLPKPGAWMETLKQFFAFPLFATVLWLLWVLGQQTQTKGWFLGSAALLLISFALWLTPWIKSLSRFFFWVLIVFFMIGFGKELNSFADQGEQSNVKSNWVPYNEIALKKAQAQGQAVFIDFTAAWCITCQVNKQTVLDTPAGQALFQRQNILLMRADWTRYDPIITEALSQLGRSSVPVYAFYPRGRSEPLLLPQILTLSMIDNLTKENP